MQNKQKNKLKIAVDYRQLLDTYSQLTPLPCASC